MRFARAARDVAAPVFKLILTLSVARLTGSVRDKVKAVVLVGPKVIGVVIPPKFKLVVDWVFAPTCASFTPVPLVEKRVPVVSRTVSLEFKLNDALTAVV